MSLFYINININIYDLMVSYVYLCMDYAYLSIDRVCCVLRLLNLHHMTAI